jgi:hypothetical protein
MLNNYLKVYWLGNLVFLLNIILLLFLLSYQFLNIEYIVAAVVCLWVVCILFSGLTTCLNSDRLTLYLRSGY